MIHTSALCFGAGSIAREIMPSVRQEHLDIKAFIDERVQAGGRSFAGKPVIGLDAITDYAFDYILVACRPLEKAAAKLRERGIPAAKIVSLDFETLLLANPALDSKERYDALAAYLRNFPGLEAGFDFSVLPGSAWLSYLLPPSEKTSSKRFCPIPFTSAWIEHDYGQEYSALRAGDVNLCCWNLVEDLTACAGNITESDSFEAIWNSERARRFRASILDGSFRYCLKESCPQIKMNCLPPAACVSEPKLKEIIATGTTVAPPPEVIELNYDVSCNIACPQCRTGIIMAKGDKLKRLETVHAHVIEKLRNPARLAVTGSGEALGSPTFLPFLRDFDEKRFPDTKITLRTNGLLFNERIWRSIQKAHSHIDHVVISIDAATKETYAKVRKPGNFSILCKNLEFARHVKETEVPFFLTFAFCVQQRNYREMGAFVDMAERYAADKVRFGMLLPNGSLVDDAYAKHAVHLTAHREHQAFLRELEDPRLKNPLVGMAVKQWSQLAEPKGQKDG